MTENQLRKIFDKIQGHCHFCGDAITFEKHGGKRIIKPNGHWEVDHVIQHGKGGKNRIENYLPACLKCNRLRWDRKGDDLRELLWLGLVAKDEIKKRTGLGIVLMRQGKKRRLQNSKRRIARKS